MIEIIRQPNESNSSALRRFSKRVQGSGLIKLTKSRRFRERPPSAYKVKKATLKYLAKRRAYERLKKLGKI